MTPIQDQLKARFEKVQTKISKVIQEQNGFEKANEYVEKTKKTIKKHPIPSLVVGLAVGFIIGKLFSDPKSNE